MKPNEYPLPSDHPLWDKIDKMIDEIHSNPDYVNPTPEEDAAWLNEIRGYGSHREDLYMDNAIEKEPKPEEITVSEQITENVIKIAKRVKEEINNPDQFAIVFNAIIRAVYRD